MLRRFSLYGFLKNQRYYEPFLVLIFLEKGLDFFQIGLLVAFRELAIDLLEIPSGVLADLWGRRGAMIGSFTAYILSFLVFSEANSLPLFFVAMAFFAVGEAFRTGTHKAMIFAWLEQQGRSHERTRIYGYTRSWSKFGSALCIIIAAVLVHQTDSYLYVFYLSVIPYALGIINFLGYPADLSRTEQKASAPVSFIRHLREGFGQALGRPQLRRLLIESMGFQGVYEATKDYLQPVIRAAAIVLASHWLATDQMSEIQRTTLLIGPVYLLLYLLAGVASRVAHRFVHVAGDEDRAAHWLWIIDGVLFGSMALAAYWRVEALVIVVFILLDTMHNVWRPVLLGRIDTYGEQEQGATLLSIESQARRLATIVTAPLLGLAVDSVRASGTGGEFWPVGVLGAGVAVIGIVLTHRRASPGA